MDQSFYLDQFYPFQDQVLYDFAAIETGSFLSGRTALLRGYRNHRFSEDLDFFVNDDANLQLWADRCI
jgi:predicted nucleotidyltransferase component of viral defense system